MAINIQIEGKIVSELTNDDEPYLSPLEEPEDPALKETYEMMQKYVGKVITPLKVFSARLPMIFNQFYTQISSLDKQLVLPQETATLIRGLVARINICLFCIDSSQAAAIQAKMDQSKINALGKYQSSPLFSEAERAALDYVTELTKNKKVNKSTFDKLAKFYSEREICEIVYLVASEHLYNISNIGLNIHSDNLCAISTQK